MFKVLIISRQPMNYSGGGLNGAKTITNGKETKSDFQENWEKGVIGMGRARRVNRVHAGSKDCSCSIIKMIQERMPEMIFK